MKYLGERIHVTLRYPIALKETLELRAQAQGKTVNEVICADIERANRNFERQNGKEETHHGSGKTDR